MQSKPERRLLPRKILRTRGIITVNGGTFPCQTIDLSIGGLCIVLQKQLELEQVGKIVVSMLVNGKKQEIIAMVKVCYCSCGRDEFKAGLQFVGELDATSKAVVDSYMK
jgi:hypothetical protein